MNKGLLNKWKSYSLLFLSITVITIIIFCSFWWSSFKDNSILKTFSISKTNVLGGTSPKRWFQIGF